MENNPDFEWWEEDPDEFEEYVEDFELDEDMDVQLIPVRGIEFNGRELTPDNEEDAMEMIKCLAFIAFDMNKDSDKLIWPVWEVNPHDKPKD